MNPKFTWNLTIFYNFRNVFKITVNLTFVILYSLLIDYTSIIEKNEKDEKNIFHIHSRICMFFSDIG